VSAEIILDTTLLNPCPVSTSAETVLEEENSSWISEPVLLKREGSISSIDQIDPAGNWQYRLGKELVWFGNFEDEGCTLWDINHPDEFYDTTESFAGRRSLCQKRSSGLIPLNTDLEDRIKIYSDTSGYTLHAYIQTENSHNAGVIIQFFESRYQSYPSGTEDLGTEISGTTDWTFYNKGFSLPAGTKFMNLRLRSESPESGTGRSWFDNVGLIEWTDWQEYTPSVKFSNPNDFYWIQLKINEEIFNAVLNYTEIKFTDVITPLSEEVSFVPDKFILYQNYPNPFNPSTVIEFSLPEDADNAVLIIYDILGQKVTQLVEGTLKAGKYKYQWDAGNFSSGVYFYQLRAVDPSTGSGQVFIQTKKMILLK
jgi:hypothetical protein